MTREDAQRKVSALLNTAAAGSGATNPERATAKRLADKLTAEYRLGDPRREGPQITITVNDVWAGAFGTSFEDTIKSVMRESNAEELESIAAKQRVFREKMNRTAPW